MDAPALLSADLPPASQASELGDPLALSEQLERFAARSDAGTGTGSTAALPLGFGSGVAAPGDAAARPASGRRGRRSAGKPRVGGELEDADALGGTAVQRHRRSSASKKLSENADLFLPLLQQTVATGDGLDLADEGVLGAPGSAASSKPAARRRRSRVAEALRELETGGALSLHATGPDGAPVTNPEETHTTDSEGGHAAGGAEPAAPGSELQGDASAAVPPPPTRWVGFAGRTLPDEPLFGRADKTSRYRGVSWDPQKRQFKSRVYYEGKEMCIGHFDTEEEAAWKRDAVAMQIQGKSARLNFPPQGQPARPRMRVSRFRGVSWQPTGPEAGMWRVRIFHSGVDITVGYFPDEQEAARAYDREAINLKGFECKLNFPDDTASTMAMNFRKVSGSPDDDTTAAHLLDMLSRGSSSVTAGPAGSAHGGEGMDLDVSGTELSEQRAPAGSDSASAAVAGRKKARASSAGAGGAARKGRTKRAYMVLADAVPASKLASATLHAPHGGLESQGNDNLTSAAESMFMDETPHAAAAGASPVSSGIDADVSMHPASSAAVSMSTYGGDAGAPLQEPARGGARGRRGAAGRGRGRGRRASHGDGDGGLAATDVLSGAGSDEAELPPGVRWRSYRATDFSQGTWEVRVHSHGKSFYVGSYTSRAEAVLAHARASANIVANRPLREGVPKSKRHGESPNAAAHGDSPEDAGAHEPTVTSPVVPAAMFNSEGGAYALYPHVPPPGAPTSSVPRSVVPRLGGSGNGADASLHAPSAQDAASARDFGPGGGSVSSNATFTLAPSSNASSAASGLSARLTPAPAGSGPPSVTSGLPPQSSSTLAAPVGPTGVARQQSAQALMDAASGLHMLAQAFDLGDQPGAGGTPGAGTAGGPVAGTARPDATPGLPKPTIHFAEGSGDTATGTFVEPWAAPAMLMKQQQAQQGQHVAGGASLGSAYNSDMSYFSVPRAAGMGTSASTMQGLTSSLGSSPNSAGTMLMPGQYMSAPGGMGLLQTEAGFFAMPMPTFGASGYMHQAAMPMPVYGYPPEYAAVVMGMAPPMAAYLTPFTHGMSSSAPGNGISGTGAMPSMTAAALAPGVPVVPLAAGSAAIGGLSPPRQAGLPPGAAHISLLNVASPRGGGQSSVPEAIAELRAAGSASADSLLPTASGPPPPALPRSVASPSLDMDAAPADLTREPLRDSPEHDQLY